MNIVPGKEGVYLAMSQALSELAPEMSVINFILWPQKILDPLNKA